MTLSDLVPTCVAPRFLWVHLSIWLSTRTKRFYVFIFSFPLPLHVSSKSSKNQHVNRPFKSVQYFKNLRSIARFTQAAFVVTILISKLL